MEDSYYNEYDTNTGYFQNAYGGLGFSSNITNDHDAGYNQQVSNNDSSHYPQQQTEGTGQEHVPDQAGGGGGGMAGSLLQSLMKQCLEYHHQQTQTNKPQTHAHDEFNNQQQNNQDHSHYHQQQPGPTEDPSIPSTIQFQPNHDNDQEQTEKDTNQERSFQQSVEEARSRANAILAKFQQLNQQHGGILGNNTTDTNHDTDALLLLPSQYKQKRLLHQQKEQEKLQTFLMKNFAYVEKRQQAQLQQQMVQLQEAQHFETQVQQQYQQALEARKQRLLGGNKTKRHQNNQNTPNANNLSSQAGIGTHKRQRVERDKSKAGHTAMGTPRHDHSVSLYVIGIPTSSETIRETLQALFGSYGTIRKLHLYRDKQTQQLKGDGLVVYQLVTDKSNGNINDEKEELLQTVCSQMNGVELPCGAVLKVEPAHQPNRDKQQQQSMSHYAPQIRSMLNKPNQNDSANGGDNKPVEKAENDPADKNVKEEKKEEKEDDSDLDDFFESLE